ncbi:hypothetical protein H4W31_006828 [Plantactinospora soyae]|uniref:Flavin reductase n=1 Tax=Plantactinospora soyae TaxID=1544732 RepID=A0A927R057_9ACTN|nr:hypothetical protein [Plantactinospora soyae]
MTLRPFARFRAHTHTRPLFLCRACGGPWPCQPARLALLAIYREDPAGLRNCLTGRLMIALADQPGTDPTALRARFLGWIPPDP